MNLDTKFHEQSGRSVEFLIVLLLNVFCIKLEKLNECIFSNTIGSMNKWLFSTKTNHYSFTLFRVSDTIPAIRRKCGMALNYLHLFRARSFIFQTNNNYLIILCSKKGINTISRIRTALVSSQPANPATIKNKNRLHSNEEPALIVVNLFDIHNDVSCNHRFART